MPVIDMRIFPVAGNTGPSKKQNIYSTANNKKKKNAIENFVHILITSVLLNGF